MSPQLQPNVLLICLDQISGLQTRPGGNPIVMTPTLSQLASLGVYYDNFYSTCPSCIAARRSLMTGLNSRSHGDRDFDETNPMPNHKTIPMYFKEQGYQTFAVGKLHVYPQRDRIGFDEVIVNEEGRHHLGDIKDDWELFLHEQGFSGQEYSSGMCNADYVARNWNLPEYCHPTNWTAREMCKAIYRRNPNKPSFWYLSFNGPHPPVWPLQDYMELYQNVDLDPVILGEWAKDHKTIPEQFKVYIDTSAGIYNMSEDEIQYARKAYFASITHIDHQIRTVLGTLRESGLLQNTVIALVSDHGEMLGHHDRWAKTLMYDMSAKIPAILVPTEGDMRIRPGMRDSRLADLSDLLPSLLDIANIDIPTDIDGISLLKPQKRKFLYGEHWQEERATRMLRDDRYKLIYYPYGHQFQLFDMYQDPMETLDLSQSSKHLRIFKKLKDMLKSQLYGTDLKWFDPCGNWIGLPLSSISYINRRDFGGQRGLRF